MFCQLNAGQNINFEKRGEELKVFCKAFQNTRCKLASSVDIDYDGPKGLV